VLTIRSDVSVPGLTGLQITDFLLEPTDARYQAWWPGTHLRFHLVRPGRPDHRGDAVYMDEIVGRRRIRHTAVVTGAVPGSRIVWWLGWRIPLPIRLTHNMTDTPDGVDIQHTITAGYPGTGRILDPLFRLYFTNRFAAAMNDHAHIEFSRLHDLLTIPDPAPHEKRQQPAA